MAHATPLYYQYTLVGLELSQQTLRQFEADFTLPDGRTVRYGDFLGNVTAHLIRNTCSAHGVCVVAWGTACSGVLLQLLLDSLRSPSLPGDDWRPEGSATHRTDTHQLLLISLNAGLLNDSDKARLHAEVSPRRQAERWSVVQDTWGDMITDKASSRDCFGAFVTSAHPSESNALELMKTCAQEVLKAARPLVSGT